MPEATPFQVMIVDDHPLMRRGVRQLLELDPGFEVVAEAGDGASAIDLANRLDIDVILLDLNMKGMSGLDTLNALRMDGVTAQIIILTVSDASSDVFALIDAGADGYLLKPVSKQDVERDVRGKLNPRQNQRVHWVQPFD